MIFQNPPYMASGQLMITRIAATGASFSPLLCEAWHGYRVTSTHRVEVEVGADGPASAPPSGAPAAAPPAGATSMESMVAANIVLVYHGKMMSKWLLIWCRATFYINRRHCDRELSDRASSRASTLVKVQKLMRKSTRAKGRTMEFFHDSFGG
jgi:hypothetical protein